MEVDRVVPFFAVKEMQNSLTFYLDGLGFEMEGKWVDEGVIRWCNLRIGNAELMLQEFRTEGHDSTAIQREQGRRRLTVLLLRRRGCILSGRPVPGSRRL